MSDDSPVPGQSSLPEPTPTQLDDVDIQDVLYSAARVAARRKKNREMFNRKRAELLDDFILNLDMLIYAELSTIYYMDCYIIRFLLRASVQFIFLTPKSSIFPAPPKPEPFIGAIAGSNLLCLILHIFSSAPAAGEATRGFLHGGLVIDLIGQKGPTSKLLLIFLDLLVITFQLIHLSAHIARMTLKEGASINRTIQDRPVSAQDIDSEERGVRRSAELQQREEAESIALQNMDHLGRVVDEIQRDRDDVDAAGPRTDAFLFDAFKNGQIVLADLNPLRTAREQVIRFQKTPAEVRASALNAHLAGRMFGLRMLAGRTANT